MEILMRLLLLLSRTFINPILMFCLRRYYRKIDRNNSLPPVNHSFLLIPAHKLAAKIRSKELTSTQVVEAYIERIEQVNPLVNCVVATRFKEALEEARNVDDILSSKNIPKEYSEENAPLLGVPFSCKECFYVKGMPCATGIIARKDFRADEDADIVKNMRCAGAILLATTNTPEACIWMESNNHLYGTTNNPYNLSRIVGGSSGGEGCLLSSAGSVIGVGSDIGGSIRIPSFFNGTYGHKSSYGLISNKIQFPPVEGEYKQKMLTSGPMCRYASDLRLLFKVQAGDLYEHMAEKFQRKVDLSSLNYYVLDNLDNCFYANPLSKECRHGLNKAVDFVEKSFNKKVIKIDQKKLKDVYFIWTALMRNGNKTVSDIRNVLANNQSFNPHVELFKSLFRRSDHALHAIIYTIMEQDPLPEPEKFLRMATELRRYFDELLGNNSIILSPSYPTVAPYHSQPMFTNMFDFVYFGIYNVLMLPSTQCPMGLSAKTGLPVGIQIVSNDKCDHLTIALAEHFEANLIGWVPPF